MISPDPDDLDAGIVLAHASRCLAVAIADIFRSRYRGAAEDIDQLADAFDRLGEILQRIKQDR